MTNTIIQGQDAAFAVPIQRDGAPLPLAGDISASVYTSDGRTVLVAPFTTDPAGAGADLPQGVVAVSLNAATTGALPPGDTMLVLTGAFGLHRSRLVVDTLVMGTRTSLFVKDIVVDEIRRDRLMAAAAGILQDVKVSDAYLWDKVRAAESEMAHTLRVPLVPTKYFPISPTDAQLAALDGMAWELDIGYDYDPAMFARDKWGYLVTKNRPIISVEMMRFAYPSSQSGYFDVPADWIRVDPKYGHIRMVPTSVAPFMSLSAFGLTALASGAVVPSMVQLIYTAGLEDVPTTFPELLDAIKKKAVLKIVADAFLPQSGSISADGLSQSLSVDMSKYADAIDEIINGPKGSNGGLMTKIHGIRSVVM